MNAWEKLQEEMTSTSNATKNEAPISFILVLTELFVLTLENLNNQNGEISSKCRPCSLANLWFIN